MPTRKGAAITAGSEQHHVVLTSDKLEVTVASAFGPRIVGFSRRGGPNAFAELGELSISVGNRIYTFHGGHRLWAAPEVPAITHEPDEDPVSISTMDSRLDVVQRPRDGLVFRKSLTVELNRDADAVAVTHTLTNQSDSPIEAAPWAITQLPPGGTALIPLENQDADPHGLQPNSSVVIWPYTGVSDSPFVLLDRMIVLDATREQATKVGTSLSRGWMAYVKNGLVFVKRAQQVADARYLDLGASAQCYSAKAFVELESLGPAALLSPGESASHIETWELHQVDLDMPPTMVPEALNLDGVR